MSAEPQFSLGPAWSQQFLSGLQLWQSMRQGEIGLMPREPLDSTRLLATLNAILVDWFDPALHFVGGGEPRLALVEQPPALAPDQPVRLLALNAFTAQAASVSVETGGICFEDPFWAIFAAQALAVGQPLALPLAADNVALWQGVARLATAIRQRTYEPEQFFAPIVGFYPAASAPGFTLLDIDPARLEALRARGMQSLLAPPRFFELYRAPAAPG